MPDFFNTVEMLIEPTRDFLFRLAYILQSAGLTTETIDEVIALTRDISLAHITPGRDRGFDPSRGIQNKAIIACFGGACPVLTRAGLFLILGFWQSGSYE